VTISQINYTNDTNWLTNKNMDVIVKLIG